MQLIHLDDIAPSVFPSGRKTRVLIGASSPVQAERFVMGRVEIEPGGKVPLHSHEQEEVYYIVSGKGEIKVGQELSPVQEGCAVYIPSNVEHELRNTGTSRMEMIFVYAPGGIVSHWQEEMEGKLI
jgi:mannose-6-phosphate isomerase-like protein (cupin superfamily)